MPARTLLIACSCVLGLSMVAAQQQSPAPAKPSADASKLPGDIGRAYPGAHAFSDKQGQPPHFVAFGPPDAGGKSPTIGYVYWTTELEPLERGYDGPIKMLVGLDLKGVITGVVVVEHREPYGNFSVEPPAFANQFKGKSIREPFRVGQDIDAISRATITVTSATRAIKNASRRMARQYLPAPGK